MAETVTFSPNEGAELTIESPLVLLSADWGDADVETTLAEGPDVVGAIPGTTRRATRQVVLEIGVNETSGTDFSDTTANDIDRVIADLQLYRGRIQRSQEFADGASEEMELEVLRVSPVHEPGVVRHQGWESATYTFICNPGWIAPKELLVIVEGSTDSVIEAEVPKPRGNLPSPGEVVIGDPEGTARRFAEIGGAFTQTPQQIAFAAAEFDISETDATLEAIDDITYVGVGTGSAADAPSTISPALDIAGLQEGDLMVARVYFRSPTGYTSGSFPAGWTQFFEDGNAGGGALLGYRFYQSGDGAPAISTPGLTTNDIVLAQVAAWRNVDPDDPIDAVSASLVNNASAQDIGPITGITPVTPGAVVVVCGSKKDDWTSVATLSGDGLTWAEIAEFTSLLGSDEAMVWDYATGWTSGAISSKTFTVTGGAAAVGAGMMFALKPGGSGNEALVLTPLISDWRSVGYLRDLPHRGSYRLRIRADGGSDDTTAIFRASYRSANGPWQKVGSGRPLDAVNAYDIDLGPIHRFDDADTMDLRIDVRGTDTDTTAEAQLDTLTITPSELYAVGRGVAVREVGTDLAVFDDFTHDAGSALGGTDAPVAPVGNETWTEAGDATPDWAIAVGAAQRVTQIGTADANEDSGQYQTVGDSATTSCTVSVSAAKAEMYGPVDAGEETRTGVVARFTDTTHWLMCVVRNRKLNNGRNKRVTVYKNVGSGVTKVDEFNVDTETVEGLFLSVDTDGFVTYGVDGTSRTLNADADLVTGGTLDNGKVGIYGSANHDVGNMVITDFQATSDAATVSTTTDVVRANGIGVFAHDSAYAAFDDGSSPFPFVPEGKRIIIPPIAGRVSAKVRTSDSDSEPDEGLTLATDLSVYHRPAYATISDRKKDHGQTYTLTVALSGAGDGDVTDDASQIDTGAADFVGVYAANTVVVLTAAADSGSLLDGWSGDGTGSGSTRTVVMTSNRTVTADFAEAPAALEIPDTGASIAEDLATADDVTGPWDNLDSCFTDQDVWSAAEKQITRITTGGDPDAALDQGSPSSGFRRFRVSQATIDGTQACDGSLTIESIAGRDDIPSAGTASINGTKQFTYTGKTNTTLTGCANVSGYTGTTNDGDRIVFQSLFDAGAPNTSTRTQAFVLGADAIRAIHEILYFTLRCESPSPLLDDTQIGSSQVWQLKSFPGSDIVVNIREHQTKFTLRYQSPPAAGAVTLAEWPKPSTGTDWIRYAIELLHDTSAAGGYIRVWANTAESDALVPMTDVLPINLLYAGYTYNRHSLGAYQKLSVPGLVRDYGNIQRRLHT